jgi:hypothetical protein
MEGKRNYRNLEARYRRLRARSIDRMDGRPVRDFTPNSRVTSQFVSDMTDPTGIGTRLDPWSHATARVWSIPNVELDLIKIGHTNNHPELRLRQLAYHRRPMNSIWAPYHDRVGKWSRKGLFAIPVWHRSPEDLKRIDENCRYSVWRMLRLRSGGRITHHADWSEWDPVTPELMEIINEIAKYFPWEGGVELWERDARRRRTRS